MTRLRLRLAAAVVPCALVCLGAAGEARAFKQAVHQRITSDTVGFLKPDFLKTVQRQHDTEDEVPGQAGKSDRHFNDCDFEGASKHLRSEYARLLDAVQKGRHQVAAERFGEILHTVQDFYAHSNWVESKQTELLNADLGEWPQLTAMQRLPSGVVLLAKASGREPPGKVKVASDMTVAVEDGLKSQAAIVSGAVWKNGKCPKAVHNTVGHWTTAPLPLRPLVSKRTYALNKDVASSDPRHLAAKALAQKQTAHEWCRVASLVSRKGSGALSALVTAWAKDAAKARQACPTVFAANK